MNRSLSLVTSLCLLAAPGCGKSGSVRDASGGGAMLMADAARFVEILPRLEADTSCGELDSYLARGSAGLRAYAEQFDVDSKKLCAAIRRRPEQYARIPDLLPLIAAKEDSINGIFVRLSELIPGAQWPDVYFVVGNGVSAGSVSGGRDPKILVGVERLSSTDGLVPLIAHEAVHTQQRKLRGIRVLTGGPRLLRATVLELSLREGAADFIASLAAPSIQSSPRFAYGEANQEQLWKEFERDMLGREHRMWIYNGWNRGELGERPADLGYYVGFKISQAYYERADDKRAAIREILNIEDHERFLRESGYAETVSASSKLP